MTFGPLLLATVWWTPEWWWNIVKYELQEKSKIAFEKIVGRCCKSSRFCVFLKQEYVYMHMYVYNIYIYIYCLFFCYWHMGSFDAAIDTSLSGNCDHDSSEYIYIYIMYMYTLYIHIYNSWILEMLCIIVWYCFEEVEAILVVFGVIHVLRRNPFSLGTIKNFRQFLFSYQVTSLRGDPGNPKQPAGGWDSGWRWWTLDIWTLNIYHVFVGYQSPRVQSPM